jgi:hypothetical protein
MRSRDVQDAPIVAAADDMNVRDRNGVQPSTRASRFLRVVARARVLAVMSADMSKTD